MSRSPLTAVAEVAAALGLALALCGCTGLHRGALTDEPAASNGAPATAPIASSAPAAPPPPVDSGSRWLPPDPLGQVSVETSPFAAVTPGPATMPTPPPTPTPALPQPTVRAASVPPPPGPPPRPTTDRAP